MKSRKKFIVFFSVFSTMVLVCTMLTPLWASAAPTLSKNATGEKVREVQRRLKAWGYYSGGVDGTFGQATEDAVKFFQKKHGIKPDGIVGAKTAEKLGIWLGDGSTSGGGSSGGVSADVYLLARCVYGEARGEPYTGKVAVAAVVLNRVEDARWPNTIAGVIYQPGAFTAVDDGQINLAPDAEALRAARDAINGWDASGGAVFYYNPVTSTNKWILSRPLIKVIGKHRFCS